MEVDKHGARAYPESCWLACEGDEITFSSCGCSTYRG